MHIASGSGVVHVAQRLIPQTPVYEVLTGDLPSDSELVECAQTDPEAFAALYLRYIDSIYAHCFWRLGDRDAAEDATSQIFTQALAGLARFDERRGPFRSWLFAIANHVVVDQYRKSPSSGRLDNAAELPAPGLSPEDHAIVIEQGRSLHAALEELPARERQVLELRHAGLTGTETGKVLGCQTGAVGVAQFRAIRKLRALLQADGSLEGPRDV
jgi:RNA polymerase sigma-70 factor (ECF subfamily)